MKTILRKLLSWMAMLAFVFSVATCYDDSTVKDLLNNLEQKLAELDKTCSQINTNISSLQSILNALSKNDYISSITPVLEQGAVIGYTLSFVNSGDVTIFHGKDGADGRDGLDGSDGRNGTDGRDGTDGTVPVIGVTQDEDGCWYWTLNGEWLLDDAGEKIKAVGTDGADGEDSANGLDGITPQLKIEDNYWYVSSDNGATWVKLGKAVGENGKDGRDGRDGRDGTDGSNGGTGYNGDTMFRSITKDNNNVYLTMSNGTVLTIPIAEPLSVSFAEEDLMVMPVMSTRDIHYTVTSLSTVTVEVATSGDIKARVIPDNDPHTGIIRVQTGSVIDEDTKVVVFVSNQTHTLMNTFTFEQAGLVLSGNSVIETSFTGTSIQLRYLSNLDCQVTVVRGGEWLHVVSTKTMEAHTITLSADPNDGYSRTATVLVSDMEGYHSITYIITQIGMQDPIVFKDASLKNVLVSNGVDTDGDGEISYVEAAAATSLEAMFGEMLTTNNHPVASAFTGFDEFQYFTGITTIPDNSFYGWKTMSSITLPESITTVGVNVLRSCYNLSSIKGKFASEDHNALIVEDRFVRLRFGQEGAYSVPEGVTTIDNYSFTECCISGISFPSTLESVGAYAFYFCDITSVTIPENVSFHETSFCFCYSMESFYGPYSTADHLGLVMKGYMVAYARASGTKDFVIPEGITGLYSYTFYNVTSLESVTVPASVTSLGYYTFYGCSGLKQLVFLGTDPSYAFSTTFYNTAGCPIYVPASVCKAYRNADGWNSYSDRILPDHEVWSVVGSFCEWMTDGEIDMQKIEEGKWALTVDWSDAGPVQFKIRKNYMWDVDFGGTLESVNTPFSAVLAGPNISVPFAGKYRIVLDLTNPSSPAITVEGAVDVSVPGGNEGIGYENW